MRLILTTLLLFVCRLSFATVPMGVYHNAHFVPMDEDSILKDLFNVSSWSVCACECLNDPNCLTVTYFGINQTCSLFSTGAKREQLRIGQFTANTSVFTFPNKTLVNNFSYNWNTTGITVAGNTSSPGSTAEQLYKPISVTLGPSNALYISDFGNNRVQRWMPDASFGSTVAGRSNGSSGSELSALSGPYQIIVDSNAGVYVADAGNHRVVYWTNGSSSGIIVAGNGTSGAANNQLNSPKGIALDSNTATIYISDTGNARIMRYVLGNSSGTVIACGNGQGLSNTQLKTPRGLFYDSSSNSLLIADSDAHNIIRWIVGESSWTLVAGSDNGTSGNTSSLLNSPADVLLDPMGNMYVADEGNLRIQLFPPNNSNGITIVGVTGVTGSNATLFNRPCALTIDNEFNMYVADFRNNRIQKFLHV